MDISPSSSSTRPESIPDARQDENSTLGDLVGTVMDMTASGFTFSGSKPELSDDGAYAEGGAAMDQRTDVIYADNAVFQRCRYYTANDTSEILPAVREDVVPGMTVSLWGEYSGDDFIAHTVQVFEPVG